MKAAYLKHGMLTDWHGKIIYDCRHRLEYHGSKYSGDEWNTDWHGFTVRLPNKRGFLIGATLGENMLILYEYEPNLDEQEAIRQAIEFAECRANLDSEEYWSNRYNDESEEEFNYE